MGCTLPLPWGSFGVLPLELKTGSSKKPAKMLSRAGGDVCVGSGGELFDPGIVGLEKGWSLGEASTV